MTNRQETTELRHQLRKQRKQLSAHQQKRHAEQALSHLQHFLYQQPQAPLRIALFLSQDGELDTHLSIQYLLKATPHKVYLPALESLPDWHMGFVEYTEHSQMITNRFGIAEPSLPLKHHLSGQQLDLVIMPLVGFDKHGNRLGMGGGYYDRTFEFKRTQTENSDKTRLIGWAHSCQQVDQLQPEPWDVPLDGIITEEGFYNYLR